MKDGVGGVCIIMVSAITVKSCDVYASIGGLPLPVCLSTPGLWESDHTCFEWEKVVSVVNTEPCISVMLRGPKYLRLALPKVNCLFVRVIDQEPSWA